MEGISIDAGMFSFEFRGKHIVTAAFLGVLIGSFGTYFVLKQNQKLLQYNQKAIA